MKPKRAIFESTKCHNPYFNRWFSAIKKTNIYKNAKKMSQSLF